MSFKEQEQQVTDYLILHRLPLDILLEVKDHMISQISDIQANENVSFEEAFHKTQKIWEDEFKTTTYSVFYSGGIPVILKRIVKEKYNNIIRKSLLLGFIAFLVNAGLVFISADQEVYNSLLKLYHSLFILVPFLCWVFSKDMRKYVRKDFKYQKKLFYTVYQQNLGIFALCINLLFQLTLRDDRHIFKFFKTDDPVSVFSLSIALVFPYLLYVMTIFLMINFLKHRESLNKMRNFLDLSVN
ncbi:hypothetical protein SAMN05421856_101747 [Chryseobacterium taichungense]|uniref:Uncharacterized protein n=1 Tax=Chryseobacterium taichungense TaxID=295069 RepID=A0A1H7WHY8_9FLAO|nr:hypothetical protein [Chryseobacterium taichungense]SEM20954.1 hypothetical protein SAMN05421856_101747 [Chryseobacterium taichungense]